MTEEDVALPKRNYFKIVWYSVLFVASLIVFLLFTFPYGVVKESIIADVSAATGLNIRVKEIGPSFPIGVDAEGIKIATQDALAQAEFLSADVTVSVLPLFIGHVTFNVELVSKNKGVLEASATFGLLQLLGGKDLVPNSINLESKDFELGPLVNLMLREKAKTADEMVKGPLTQINFVGNMTGKVDVKLVSAEPIQSSGTVDLQFKKALLDFNIPNLVVARQNFEKALIKGNLTGGKLTIDPNSALNSQELKVAFKGNSTLRNPFEQSILDFTIGVKLEGTIKDNFGVFMSFMGGNENGVNYKISGTTGRPAFAGSTN